MATIINPITTVLLNRQELESGEFERFPFKYILEDDGTISYFSKLSAGRHVFSHEAKVGGLGKVKTNKPPVVSIQCLAHKNKIPGEMFGQVKQFFLDVMDMGPSTYEAQIFIVWNDNSQDYRIIVPKQTVSAAAVRYDIGDLLGEGDTIIVDIHSHNNMGAFFSGTDDADDKKNPWISGVFGKLSTTLEHKFRFNDGCGRHFALTAEDVFDFGEKIATPSEWLAQVQIETPSYRVPSYQNKQAYSGYGGYAGSDQYTKFSARNIRNQFDHKNGSGESDEVRKSPLSKREGAEEWKSPSNGNMGGFDQFEDFFTDQEGDLYDELVDELSSLDGTEALKVLNAELEYLSSGDASDVELSERELVAFVAIDHAICLTGDKPGARDVLDQLISSYKVS
jgi:PRTRC genetic system protein A